MRSLKRRELYDAQDEVEARREELIAEVAARLEQQVATDELFLLRWSVV